MINKVCTIKILDEVNAAIFGLRTEEYQIFHEHYGIFADNYYFNPKFKLGRWDGKIRFFSKNGMTYNVLLPEIIDVIKDLGYKFKLEDKRSPIQFDIPAIDENYLAAYGVTLGEHQVEAVNSIIEYGNGIIEAGTGAGKSLVNATLCDLYNKLYNFKTITIVPTTDLISQIKAVLSSVGLDTGEYSGSVKDLNHPHIVSTWQSIQNNETMMSQFQMVICDEAHLASGKSLQSILNQHGSKIVVRIGLTGTVPITPANAMTLRVTLGDVRYKIAAATLIEKGWLADLKIKIYKLVENLSSQWQTFKEKNPEEWEKITYKEFKTDLFPDYPSEKSFLEKKKSRNQFIADLVESRRTRELGNSFVLVNSVKHGAALKSLIPNSHFVHGADSKEIRKQIYDLFNNNNDVVVIATYKLASTGLNIPRIFHLFLIDGGKGFIKLIQSIGRGLRKADDKDEVEVIDIGSDLKWSVKHMKERIKHYKSQSYNYIEKTIEYE